MQRYEGTKRLAAQPMTRGAYNEYRGWEMPANEDPSEAGYLVEYEDGGKANDSRHLGYISWSPADVFERSYKPLGSTFVQPKVTGYRQLSEAEVALMNEGKALAQACGDFIDKLRQHANALPGVPAGAAQVDGMPTLDQRWVSIGATQLQQGFMAVIRGIAQPTTF